MKYLFLLMAIMATQYSQAQSITITIEKPSTASFKEAAKYDFENYLVQNLITYKIDTLKVKNGKIRIPNKTTTITPYALARTNPRQAILFFVVPKKDFELNISEPQLSIKSSSGSYAQNEYANFMQRQEVYQKQYQLIQNDIAQQKNDSLQNRLTYLQMEMNASYIEMIASNKNNNLGAYLIFDIANKNQNMSAQDLSGLYDKLDTLGKLTYFGKQIGNRIIKLTSMNVGSMAPDFTLKNKLDRAYTLSNLKGKYVLVDFWASWCGPCIKEIPHLKEAYEKYHQKGFEIISVSIDTDKNKWLQAVERYNMPWISVIDHEKAEDKITQNLYHVPSIPRTILLDPSGMVIGKDYRGPALEQKLAELLH